MGIQLRPDGVSDTIFDAELAVTGWADGDLPPNVRIGPETTLLGPEIFRKFRSRLDPALTIGAHCTMDGVHFALGQAARVEIGDYCSFSDHTMLLCEEEIRIGSYVVLGWNVTLADTDFHPIDPVERIADVIACSSLGDVRSRPPLRRRPVIVEDDVWIGPNATILKGVRIGTGAFIEPGALVTQDVPPRARVLGNPSRIIGEV